MVRAVCNGSKQHREDQLRVCDLLLDTDTAAPEHVTYRDSNHDTPLDILVDRLAEGTLVARVALQLPVDIRFRSGAGNHYLRTIEILGACSFT